MSLYFVCKCSMTFAKLQLRGKPFEDASNTTKLSYYRLNSKFYRLKIVVISQKTKNRYFFPKYRYVPQLPDALILHCNYHNPLIYEKNSFMLFINSNDT